MRVVRLANFVGPQSGGLRTALRELGIGYRNAGHEPVLIIPGEQASDQQTAQGRVITCQAPVAPGLGGDYRAIAGRRELSALLDELKPDRLEVSDQLTLRWVARWARRNGVPAVMVAHESLTRLFTLPVSVPYKTRWRNVVFHSELFYRAASWAATFLARRSAREYDEIVCTTKWAASEFENIGAPNVTLVTLGTDLDLFSPERYSEVVRAEYAGPDQTLLIHCGRLSMEKKPQRSIRALAELRATGTDAVLVVAGDGPLRPDLERMARDAGLPVSFTGFIEDPKTLAALLATADVDIAPGPVETFGLAALEALACGTPVVASAESALPEVLGAAGLAADGEDFASAVRAILSRPEEQRRAAARQRAEEFGWHAAVSKFLAVHQTAGEQCAECRKGRSTINDEDRDARRLDHAGHGRPRARRRLAWLDTAAGRRADRPGTAQSRGTRRAGKARRTGSASGGT
jgi:alpha-1,6-mannosyltransferase